MPESNASGDFLIADDDQAFLDLLCKTFRRDFNVHAASDGKRALELLEGLHPVAILVDEMMPFVSGTQVLARAKSRHPAAARMLMTASTEFSKAVEAVNTGELHRFFSKPLRPMELRQVVLSVVERVRAEALLRVELDTLKSARAPEARPPRALFVGVHASASDVLREACELRRYEITSEAGLGAAQALMTNRAFDLVVVQAQGGMDTTLIVHLARTLDESLPVIVVDPEPTWTAATAALGAGAVDFMGVPLPGLQEVADRMERALHGRLLVHDLRRVTGDLVSTNRKLAVARRTQEEQQVKVLNAMVRALEARDGYTAGHTDRVAAISVRLAEELRLPAEKKEMVRVGALLHDIGKIGVRDSVLLKPDLLTPDEFEVIKTHTTLGDELLRDVDQFRCVVPIIRAHHERLDGSGYPDGLKGTQIPLEARIVAVADVTDAITSTRPYRVATGLESAFAVLARLEKGRVDPAVVEALRTLHRQRRLEDLLQPVSEHET
ncbi:MAG: HD domain-containing protein [Deltaproteobacteria bacterium]|nr:HD domain-containing protein [Deltaproteobacteria bacterium]